MMKYFLLLVLFVSTNGDPDGNNLRISGKNNQKKPDNIDSGTTNPAFSLPAGNNDPPNPGAARSFSSSFSSVFAYPQCSERYTEKWCFPRCQAVPWEFNYCRAFRCRWKPSEAYTLCGTKVKVHPHSQNGQWQTAAYCVHPNRPCNEGFCNSFTCKPQAHNFNGYCPQKRCTQLYDWKRGRYWVQTECETKWRNLEVWIKVPYGCNCERAPEQICQCRRSDPFPWFNNNNDFPFESFPSWSGIDLPPFSC